MSISALSFWIGRKAIMVGAVGVGLGAATHATGVVLDLAGSAVQYAGGAVVSGGEYIERGGQRIFQAERDLLAKGRSTIQGVKDDFARENGYAPMIGSYIVDEGRASHGDIKRWVENAAVRYHARGTGLTENQFRRLYASIVLNESTHNSDALSKKGAIGVAQVMPLNIETCNLKSVKDLIEPESNVDCGGQILAANLRTAKGDISVALALYNWGYVPGSIDKKTGKPRIMPEETKKYIAAVIKDYKEGSV